MAHRGYPGPYQAASFSVDTLVWPPAAVATGAGPGTVGGLTLDNGSAAAVVFTVYDSRAASGKVILVYRVPAATSVQIPLSVEFHSGLFVSCSLWTTCTASVQYAAK